MFSHEPEGYDCPMCRYARGEETAVVGQDCVVERTDDTLTFVSPRWWPNNHGHLLVIPTEHHENLYDLPDRLGQPLLRATRRAATALRVAYGCDGTSTRQHNEPAGNQDVWHVHTHVFPRYENDDLYALRPEPGFASREQMRTFAEQLRGAYDNLH